MKEKEIVAEKEYEGVRVDIFLAQSLLDYSRSKIKKLILAKNIFIIRNSQKEYLLDISQKVLKGDIYIIHDIPEKSTISPKKIDIEVLFEDDYLVVINKQAGLVVHPGAGNFDNTLVNGLLYKYQNNLSSINGDIRAGIVHRLDKNTSGVLVIAKNDNAHALLAKQFAEHSIQRNYRALVWGVVKPSKGLISTYIKRSDHNRLKMAVTNIKGKLAKTEYKVLRSYNNYLSLVDLKLHTGRTHQIRVHMSHLGHPLVGDSIYGSNNSRYLNKLEYTYQVLIKQLERHALHAYKLGFMHPITNEYILVQKEEPQELIDLYSYLKV